MPISLDDLRKLIVDAAPDAALAAPVLACGDDTALDDVIPFSSLILLGVIVAVEDTYRIKITNQMLKAALAERPTLRRLADMIEAAR
jgi:acyl carrier protein